MFKMSYLYPIVNIFYALGVSDAQPKAFTGFGTFGSGSQGGSGQTILNGNSAFGSGSVFGNSMGVFSFYNNNGNH